MRKIPFPDAYVLPPAESSPTGTYTTDFQKEWIEVNVVREAPETRKHFPRATQPEEEESVAMAPVDDTIPDANCEGCEALDGIVNTATVGRLLGTDSDSGVHSKLNSNPL